MFDSKKTLKKFEFHQFATQHIMLKSIKHHWTITPRIKCVNVYYIGTAPLIYEWSSICLLFDSDSDSVVKQNFTLGLLMAAKH